MTLPDLGLKRLEKTDAIKILLVDPHEVVRDGVKWILEELPGATVFGEAGTKEEAVDRVREQEWDVVVLDPHLDDGLGLDVVKELKRIRPALPVVIFDTHLDEHFARRALTAGASGYLVKDSPSVDLLNAVHKVIGGGRYLSESIAEKLIFEHGVIDGRQPHELLSDRESEVLRLIASGKSAREIASMLSLSDSTVSTYRSRILVKMRMKTNAELTRYVVKKGLWD